MPNYPTEEQFLSHPRAKELRQICLDIAASTDRLLHQRDVVAEDEYVRLEQLNGHLIEMGITPHFKVGLDPSAYEDALTMVEYVAGQWVDVLGKNIPSEKSIMPIVQEFSEASSGNAHALSGKNIPPKLKVFMVMRSFVNMTYLFLDFFRS